MTVTIQKMRVSFAEEMVQSEWEDDEDSDRKHKEAGDFHEPQGHLVYTKITIPSYDIRL